MGNGDALFCKMCGNEIYSNNFIYDEKVVCEECYAKANSTEYIVKFAKAYPDIFFENLEECAIVQSEAEVIDMLNDFKHWNEEAYNKWIFS